MDYKKEAKKELKEDRDGKIIDEIKQRLLQIEGKNKKIDELKVEIKGLEKEINLLAEGKLDVVRKTLNLGDAVMGWDLGGACATVTTSN